MYLYGSQVLIKGFSEVVSTCLLLHIGIKNELSININTSHSYKQLKRIILLLTEKPLNMLSPRLMSFIHIRIFDVSTTT